MSSLHSNAAHQKLSAMKKKLYQDGYRFPMDVESLPLIEKLYADLVCTKETLRRAEMNSNEVTSTSTLENEHMDLYKKENIKLIKENNNLHNQLVKLQMASEDNLLELKRDFKKLERENSELKFLNTQYAHQVKTLEMESSQKTERILQLQDKNHPASMHITGGGKKKFPPFRKQRMELDRQLPPADQTFLRSSSSESRDGKSVDLLLMAEEAIGRLKQESSVLKSEVESLKNKLASGAKQLEMKDAEVERLMKIIEGGGPSEVSALEVKNRRSQKTIGHLNRQIDQLQVQLANLRAQVEQRKVFWEGDGDDNNNNDNNNREERDCNNSSRSHRLSSAKLHKELEAKQVEINRLNAELVSKERELRKNLQMDAERKRETDDLILRLQEEKNALSAKVSEMTKNEKDLVLELNKMKHLRPKALNFGAGNNQNNNKKSQGKPPSGHPPSVTPSAKAIEEERDYYKGEVETLIRVLSTVSMKRGQDRGSASPHSQGSLSGATSPINKNCSCSVRGDQAGSQEVSALRKERDELKATLENFDKHFKEIQSSMKVLTLERDHLSALYSQVFNDMSNLHERLKSTTKEELDKSLGSDRGGFERSYAPTNGAGDFSIMKRLEEEREVALGKVRNLKRERDELLKEMREMDDMIRAEREEHEKVITDLKAALEDSFKESSNKRQESRTDLDAQLRQARDEAAQHKATASQMKLIADQAEESVKKKEAALSSAQSELRSAFARVDEMERKMEELRKERMSKEGDMMERMEKMRRSMERLDRTKEELQAEVGLKAEAQAKLSEAQRAREKQVRELQISLQEADSALNKLRSELMAKDRDVVSMGQRIESLQEDLKFTRRLKDGLAVENRKIQEESENVSRDAQTVTKDLNEAIRLKNKMSAQAQEYLNEVKRCQELLNSKEQEKFDILEQYRLLNEDLSGSESRNLALEAEVSRLRIELHTRESEAKRLREIREQNDRAKQDRATVERSREVQMSGLTKDVGMLKENVQRLEQENQMLNSDVKLARSFVARVELEKEQLERQLSIRAVDIDKLQALLEGKRKEIECLKMELEDSQHQRAELESLIQTAKTKEWQAEMALQEKQSETQLLKDRLALNDNKIENQSKELSFHRSKMVEMDAEVEKLKRQVISEKFERERLLQAMRVHNVTLPGDSRLGAISPDSLSRKINSEKVTLSKDEFIKKYNLDEARRKNGHLAEAEKT